MFQYKYFNRKLTAKLLDLFAHFPTVVISGARQVGKSTLLEHAFAEMPRIVFDPANE